MAFESASRQNAVVQQLLPLQDPTSDDSDSAAPTVQTDYEFSPDSQSLLGELLPASVRAQLFQCFNESVVSEQVARMIAMSAATDNATQMGKDLTRLYNRARQATITTELTEIISGAAALE
jgi:F-type H+-transporting ATPase subunit gamma